MSKNLLIISDLHLSKSNDLLFNKYDVEKNLDIIVNDIQRYNLDYIFVLGDISQDGSIESYTKFKNIFNKFKCGVYLIMGNHDSYNIKTIISNNIYLNDYIDILNNRFIFISTFKNNNSDSGLITDKEFQKIDKLYDVNKNNFILLHHHFIKTNSFMDDSILDNYLEFIEYIKKLQIKAIFHGHVHNPYIKKINQTKIIASPSTCVQFALTKQIILKNKIGYQYLTINNNEFKHEFFIKNF